MERFWSKVDVQGPDDCWLWTAQIGRGGYGKFKFSLERGHVRAHRMVWEFIRGAPPLPGQWVLHHCDVPACVNPRHLYLGTPADNVRDREVRERWSGPRFEKQDQCKYGHPLEGDNVYITYPPSQKGRPMRQCRECGRRKQREYQARKKVAA